MYDVARLSGVSHQTVSRVLNDHPNVRRTTRTRVLAAMAELSYRPNSAARTLVTGRSRVVGIITQSTLLYGPTSMHFALARELDANGLAVGIASVASLSRASIAEAVNRLLDQRVGGIVVLAHVKSADEAIDDLPGDLPAVVIEGDPRRSHRVATVDQEFGARLATRHLLALGHRTVWHVSGPADWYDSERRVCGWRTALTEAGVEIPPVITADWSLRAGFEAGQSLGQVPDATAVFAANDHLALGIMKALAQQGRRVPDDISVVGFDDIPESAYLNPTLTTVRPDFDAVAAAAVAMLLQQMGGGDTDTGTTAITIDPVPPTLVARESSRPPR